MLTLFPENSDLLITSDPQPSSHELNKCLLDKLLHANIVLPVEMTKTNYVLVYFLQKFPIKTSKKYINSHQESRPEERYKQTALEKPKGKDLLSTTER